jgi:hypothetical protein
MQFDKDEENSPCVQQDMEDVDEVDEESVIEYSLWERGYCPETTNFPSSAVSEDMLAQETDSVATDDDIFVGIHQRRSISCNNHNVAEQDVEEVNTASHGRYGCQLRQHQSTPIVSHYNSLSNPAYGYG